MRLQLRKGGPVKQREAKLEPLWYLDRSPFESLANAGFCEKTCQSPDKYQGTEKSAFALLGLEGFHVLLNTLLELIELVLEPDNKLTDVLHELI